MGMGYAFDSTGQMSAYDQTKQLLAGSGVGVLQREAHLNMSICINRTHDVVMRRNM